MSDIHTFSLLGSVLITSIWSVVCLKRTDTGATKTIAQTGFRELLSHSKVTAAGLLSLESPLEQLRSAEL